jgi:transposase-like protein
MSVQKEAGPAAAGAANRPQGDRLRQKIDSVSTEKKPTQQHWRDRLSVHPKAEKYPLLRGDELDALANDIKAHGLRYKVKAYIEPGTDKQILLDGRNRLNALERLDRKIFLDDGRLSPDVYEPVLIRGDEKPEILEALIDSLNAHRRHLTPEQKRKAIAEALKANPEKSDRRVAAALGVSHPTVAKERREQERRGKVFHAATHTDTKGRSQPATKTIKVTVRDATVPIVAPFTVVESGGGPPKAVSLNITPADNAEQRKQVNELMEDVPDNAPKAEKASAWALAQFKVACTTWLPKMSEADRHEAQRFCADEHTRLFRPRAMQ